MSKLFGVINKSTGVIDTRYNADAHLQAKYGGAHGNSTLYEHLEIPQNFANNHAIIYSYTNVQFELEPTLNAARIVSGWETVRVQRTKLLTDTDWTMVTDSPLSDAKKIEFGDYRILLRDLPILYGGDDPNNLLDPDLVVYPTAPSTT